ncbi:MULTISPECIES: hydroxyethylthiazole kinase [Pelosinus]|jgi:hydroxyethylthiazole kinase|uniref:Hydroxyethylthiazole kinase n=1 Tax=Pelosinus fermentans B4 TaxID=1149862 RepID=I9LJ12_9FIRM|nr:MULTISPECIES: hydroxyethylthiazole kinase [Pelosinus]EIW20534.1 hydroxyethylthiazole kinase [Pelosinus fermentans B4]EIW25751.1 Hydroxyethylthiazole kinase [Pelosinus fermentans A11]OAM93475.1 Hydroxyethylthiazole kinase [Pelosinus fermentans DSM 17108]SDQ79157.1 hydroxyethylthiazole kinase [Pelosinus fermentans]
MEILQKISDSLITVKTKKPLVHHITNYVTVNDCANITLTIGASPVMADDIGEVEEMVSFASSLVLNIGTLNSRSIESMLAVGKKAKERGIPIVFDPVGVGATSLRTATAKRIIEEVGPSVIRGNMSEMKILAGLEVQIKGVDSTADEEDGKTVAKLLSKKLNCVIAITGKQDIIAQGDRVCLIDNGHPILSQVTGTGCMATSLVASFCGATEDWFVGAAAGIMIMGLAGELAQQSLQAGEGIGTFRMRLFDAVWAMTPELMKKGGVISNG